MKHLYLWYLFLKVGEIQFHLTPVLLPTTLDKILQAHTVTNQKKCV